MALAYPPAPSGGLPPPPGRVPDPSPPPPPPFFTGGPPAAPPHGEYPRGGDGPRGGHEQREHPGQFRGGKKDRLVPRHGGHGREGIHGLGPGDPRQKFQGEGGAAVPRRFPEGFRGAKRIAESDEDLALAKEIVVGPAGSGVGAQCAHLEDHDGGCEQFGPGRLDLRPLLPVCGVRESGGIARTRFHNRTDSFFRKGRKDAGYESDAPLPGERLFGNCHNQGFTVPVLSGSKLGGDTPQHTTRYRNVPSGNVAPWSVPALPFDVRNWQNASKFPRVVGRKNWFSPEKGFPEGSFSRIIEKYGTKNSGVRVPPFGR